jgi:hypothetical protein
MADEERNCYKDTLRTAYTTTIPNAKDNVHHGTGQPGDSVHTAISGGGWKCAKATDFLTEFSAKCKQIMPKFEDAVSTAKTAHDAEPDQVPKDDYRGLRWPRSWAARHKMI